MPCPYRPELSIGDMPESIRRRPVDARGFPIPFFVDYLPDGTPEFRAADPEKHRICLRESRCWVCGDPLHRSRLGFRSTIAFVIGPMCAVNRISSEPPSHPDCSEWSARNCPFLARPHMRRRQDELINDAAFADRAPGLAITRNPGVALVWYTNEFRVERVANGRLYQIGEPTRPLTWWAEGRPATRAEVLHSIETGLPFLRRSCDEEATPERRAAATEKLDLMVAAALRLIPAEAVAS